MAGALRNALVYFGLAAEDGEYDPYADELQEHAEPRERGGRSEYAEVTPLRRVPARNDVIHPIEVGGVNRISTVHPSTYNDATLIGQDFRNSVPVIMDLSDLSDNDAKRLVDFAAGLVFGLSGSIARVTKNVFLLSPSHVNVSEDDSRTEAAKDLFNQG